MQGIRCKMHVYAYDTDQSCRTGNKWSGESVRCVSISCQFNQSCLGHNVSEISRQYNYVRVWGKLYYDFKLFSL